MGEESVTENPEEIAHDNLIPWYTKAMFIANFHDRMLEKHGHRNHRHEWGWSTTETAKLLKISNSHAVKNICVGRLLNKNIRLKNKYRSVGEMYKETK